MTKLIWTISRISYFEDSRVPANFPPGQSKKQKGRDRYRRLGGRLIRRRTATLEEIGEALPYGVEEIVGSLAHAHAIDTLAETNSGRIRVHLCVNAGGMSRDGIDLTLQSGMNDALRIVKLSHLKLVGLMTHFPLDDADDVRKVPADFHSQVDELIARAELDRSALRLHAANSFATIEVPASHLDMVRVGGALYGDTVPSPYRFERLMAFKTRVGSVNAYRQGETVSYDRTYTLTRDSRLANVRSTIPMATTANSPACPMS